MTLIKEEEPSREVSTKNLPAKWWTTIVSLRAHFSRQFDTACVEHFVGKMSRSILQFMMINMGRAVSYGCAVLDHVSWILQTVVVSSNRIPLPSGIFFPRFLQVDLPSWGLTSCDALRAFPNLQYVDVSGNNLRSLEPLGELPFLLRLNASRNRIVRTQSFGPPRRLEICDLS